jgi:hypothetical protein
MFELLLMIWTFIKTFILLISAIILLSTITGIFSGGNHWTKFIALAFDFFWNVMFGGQIGVTISARAYIAKQQGKQWGEILVCGLSRLNPNHCELAVQGDIDRAKAVIKTLSPYDERLKS